MVEIIYLSMHGRFDLNYNAINQLIPILITETIVFLFIAIIFFY